MRENAVEIVLAHREADHPDIAAVPLQQAEGGLVWVRAQPRRILPEPRAFGCAIGSVVHAGDQHVVPAADELDLRQRLAFDAIGGRGIRQTRDESARAVVAAPYRE